MEYQKIIKLLDNTPNQPTKLRKKNWIEMNDDAGRTYNTNSQIKFETSVLKSNLCDYGNACILVCGTITVQSTGQAANSKNGKNIIIKNCASFADCINEIKNTQIDTAKYIDIVIPMYNLMKYRGSCSKTFGSFCQYCRDQPFLNAHSAITDFPADNNKSASFKFKTKIAEKIGNNGTKMVKF